MIRLMIAILLLLCFTLKSDGEETKKVDCNWDGIEIDSQGCVDVFWYQLADKQKCSNMPNCFKLQYEEVVKEQPKKQQPKKKEFFTKEDTEEKKKIIPILDNSAIALLKNSNLKNIKIIFYNKGKLSKDFAKEAEQYILDKGVKKDQFIIEIK
jgi:hypothetical protein